MSLNFFISLCHILIICKIRGFTERSSFYLWESRTPLKYYESHRHLSRKINIRSHSYVCIQLLGCLDSLRCWPKGPFPSFQVHNPKLVNLLDRRIGSATLHSLFTIVQNKCAVSLITSISRLLALGEKCPASDK